MCKIRGLSELIRKIDQAEHLIGDKVYDSEEIPEQARSQNMNPVILANPTVRSLTPNLIHISTNYGISLKIFLLDCDGTERQEPERLDAMVKSLRQQIQGEETKIKECGHCKDLDQFNSENLALLKILTAVNN